MTPETTKPKHPINPWLFIPILYFMQAIPVTVVQEVATVFYKDLGIANEPITRWTSLIALPWSLQLLLGPLVDLNFTKRAWILGGQAVITIGLGLTAFLLNLPHAFEISLVVLAATAVTSALCNIATDGFYILSMAKDQQAKFVGVPSTCYRLGRLFCVGLVVMIAGRLMTVPRVHVDAGGLGFLHFKIDDKSEYYTKQADIGVANSSGGPVTNGAGETLLPEIVAPPGTIQLNVSPDGVVHFIRTDGSEEKQVLRVASFPVSQTLPLIDGRVVTDATPTYSSAANLSVGAGGRATLTTEAAWGAVLLVTALIYGVGSLWNRRAVPRPEIDQPAVQTEPHQNRKNLLRTLVLLMLGLGGYFLLNSVVRLSAHGLWKALDGDSAGRLKGWMLATPAKIVGIDLGLGGVATELVQLVVCALVVIAGVALARRLLRGSPMADAFTSYLRQPGIAAIFGFILFYRFGEAMVSKMTPLFLKDTLEKGGLAIPNEQLGAITGIAGVLGIVIGGILGGITVSKLGLRRSFWLLAVAMHTPNLLYLWASYNRPPLAALYGIAFVDQFGYGFGFAGYMLYLMWVAQRGNYKTSHYAIGTGLGALCIATAGIVSGIVQANFGYHGFFWSVIVLSFPGLAMLWFIPLDEANAGSA